MGRLVGLAVVLGLAACSTPPPPPGSEIRMEVLRPASATDVDPAAPHLLEEERRHRRLATAMPGLVRAGRVVVARCGLGRNELWFAMAVLPEGQGAGHGKVVRVRLGDRERGDPDEVLGPVTEPPGLVRGSIAYNIVAYRSIVPWSVVAVEGEVDPFVEAQYWRTRFGYVVKCVAP